MKGVVLCACLIAFGAVAIPGESFAGEKLNRDSPAWKPEQFPGGNELPPKYSGLDRRQLYSVFTASISKIKPKDEFETTQEYEKRLENVQGLLSPIEPGVDYAIEISDIKFSYDADLRRFTPELRNLRGRKYSCLSATLRGKRANDYLICEAGEVHSTSSKYQIKGYSGRAIDVLKTNDRSIGLAISPQDPVYRKYFSPDSVRDRGFSYPIEMEIEQAKSLKESSIKVLLVGNVTKAEMPTYVTSTAPTKDFPYDIYNETVGVPFKLSRIIIYVYESGKVLATLEPDNLMESSNSPESE